MDLCLTFHAHPIFMDGDGPAPPGRGRGRGRTVTWQPSPRGRLGMLGGLSRAGGGEDKGGAGEEDVKSARCCCVGTAGVYHGARRPTTAVAMPILGRSCLHVALDVGSPCCRDSSQTAWNGMFEARFSTENLGGNRRRELGLAPPPAGDGVAAGDGTRCGWRMVLSSRRGFDGGLFLGRCSPPSPPPPPSPPYFERVIFECYGCRSKGNCLTGENGQREHLVTLIPPAHSASAHWP